MPTLDSTELVPLDRGTSMFVHVATVSEAALPDADDEAVSLVMSWPWFAWNGLGAMRDDGSDGVHAEWLLTSLTATSYRRVSTQHAERRLRSWASAFGWRDRERQSEAALERMAERVHPLLRSGTVFMLEPPTDDECRWPYSPLGSNSGTVDLIVLDRARDRVHLILATDD
ncbi:hypothetical protein KC207_15825 [Phycicoccus sp. BSK3Z-2]|uniref:Uncharacterized protein n=1 Tax=Phycicoccus avicenniae TaxID=2828860 RepID=A0A941DAZ0_9MICO|nr:hypothetical protein [Phycicoccus avicenniae]MBR7744766.1 hypothetical protein [Phycicoccus avicenniae]